MIDEEARGDFNSMDESVSENSEDSESEEETPKEITETAII